MLKRIGLPMNLTAAEQMLLKALRAALRGESVEEEHSAGDWEALMALSAAHKVLPLVGEAVYACPSAREVWSRYKARSIAQVTAQTVKSCQFMALYDRMRQEGLHPLVVKGIVCRALYPRGDHRISGDEDLFVPDGEFSACCEALRRSGLVPTGDEEGFEVGWRREGSPLYIELHRRLFAPDAGAYGELERFFDASRRVSYPVEGGSVDSLTPHDHMLYLLLHAYKHFIHSGFGIRQVCDIGLWAKVYGAGIDWERLYEQCGKAHALTFSAAVFQIARRYLGVELALPRRWEAISTDCEPMLRDLLGAGIYGSAQRSRLHSATVTLGTVESQRKAGRGGMLGSLFPSRRSMEGKYPVLKKHPWLLPGAWCLRLVRYGAGTLTAGKENSAAEALRIARERTELLRFYDIIE